jgi:MFS family permease
MCTIVRMPSSVPLDVRRARIAVSALFLTNGALFANIVPRLPEIKTTLGVDTAVYGLLLAAWPLGSFLFGLLAAPLMRRFGSAPVAAIGTVLIAVALLGAGLAPTAVLFAVPMFVGGALDAVVDVGQNTHGLEVQRRFGRSIINSLHAIWSIGAVLGGAMAAAAIAFRIPVPIHLAIAGALFSVSALVAWRFCLPRTVTAGADDAVPEPVVASSTRPRGRALVLLIALVVIAVAGVMVEDLGSSWSTLYLSDSLGAAGAIAATGYIALIGAQFVGRILGDRFTDRFGAVAVARAGGILIAIGLGVALAFPTVPGTIIGLAAAGFGSATIVPAAMHAADELPGLREGTGLTFVAWLMRLGFLIAPPAVGILAEQTDLRTALVVYPIAGVVVVLLATVLRPRRTDAVR